jgi:hypothetical protein
MLFIASIVSFVFLVFSNHQEWQNNHVKGVCDVYTSIIKTSPLKLFGRKKRSFEEPVCNYAPEDRKQKQKDSKINILYDIVRTL